MNLADMQPLFSQLPAVAAATGITVAGRKAIARLVTGVSDLAMIRIDDALQNARDKREARSIVSKSLAEAVAKSVSADPELVERAAIVQLGEASRKQQAREKVAEAAIEELAKAKTAEVEPGPTEETEIDEDWMNVFVGYAEKASSERLQQMWGRVLAGQITKPGNFSPATLRTISELSTEEAKNFEIIALDSVGNSAPKIGKIKLAQLVDLEAAGLLTGVSSGLRISWNPIGRANGVLMGDKYAIFIDGKSSGHLDIIRLTQVGRQCARLVSGIDEYKSTMAFAELFKAASSGDKIIVGRIKDGNISQVTEL